MQHGYRYVVTLVLGLTVVACGGGGGSSPTAPAAPVLNISGIWDVVQTLTSGNGHAPCIGNFFVGQQFQSVASIQHTGTTLTSTVTDPTGFQSSYSGTLQDGQFLVTLQTPVGSLPFSRISCSDGAYDLRLSTSSVNGTATSTVITGTSAETRMVYFIPPFPFSQQGLLQAGSITLQANVRLTKR